MITVLNKILNNLNNNAKGQKGKNHFLIWIILQVEKILEQLL